MAVTIPDLSLLFVPRFVRFPEPFADLTPRSATSPPRNNMAPTVDLDKALKHVSAPQPVSTSEYSQ